MKVSSQGGHSNQGTFIDENNTDPRYFNIVFTPLRRSTKITNYDTRVLLGYILVNSFKIMLYETY